ncbi:MAG: glycosyltransferase family 2 protein [Planctomycetes bacterium]|nr:glycosyltransferase family 2 protein [Planctomycetota bacterium]
MNDDQQCERWPHGLSVFLPCYNEQENIRRVVGQCVTVLDRLVADWELILVDDGSTDDTGRIADELAGGDQRIRAIHHKPNRGYGAALQSGFLAAKKEFVFYTDGDGQFDVTQLDRLLRLAQTYDIVSGYRMDRQDNLIRRFNARAWGMLVKKLLRFQCSDIDSAFKLYRREIFDRIEMKSSGALIDAEILARATRAGYTIGEVGVSHLPRLAGTSTGGNIKVIARAFRELWQLRKDILATPPRR